jgi:hypothetical protein
MFINLTECKNCVKQDVCKIKDEYQYATEAVARANTTNENNSIHHAIDNDAINVTAKCTKYVVTQSTIR